MFDRLFVTVEPVERDDGTALSVAPLTLRDLAELERWARRRLESRDPDATPAILDRAASEADPDARRQLLARAYDAAEAGPVDFATPGVAAELGSIEGLAKILELAIRPCPDPDLALALAATLSPREWTRFNRVAWSVDPRVEAERAIDAEIGIEWPTGFREPHAMRASVWRVIEATGWTLAQIAGLTLGQWDQIRRGAEPDDNRIEPPPGVSWDELEERVQGPRRVFWAGIESNGGEATNGGPES
jgi:hypothetical protein